MAEISSFSGLDISSVDSVSGLSLSNMASIGGVDLAKARAAQESSLIGWWDPSQARVGDTTVPSLAYTYGYTSVDHYQVSSRTSIVSLNGLSCWYLDGVNDTIGTANLNDTNTAFPLSADFTEFTIEGWVRSNGAWVGNGNWWNMGYNGAYRNRFTTSGNLWNYPKTSRQTSGTFATNTWWHITVTMKPNSTGTRYDTLKVYKNGSLMQQWTGINQDPSQSGRTCFWGAFSSRAEFGRFYLGMHRLYTKELTASEVASNFDLEKAQYGY